MKKYILILLLLTSGVFAQATNTTVRQAQLDDSVSTLRTDLATKIALSDSTTELKDSLANRLLRMLALEDSSASYNTRVNVLEDSSTAYNTKFNTLQIEKWTDNDTGITFSGKFRIDSLFTNALIDIVDTSEIVNNSIPLSKLADGDYGDFTKSTTISLDANVVNNAKLSTALQDTIGKGTHYYNKVDNINNDIINNYTVVTGVQEASSGYYNSSTGAFVSLGGWLSKKFTIDADSNYYVTTYTSGAVTAMAVYYEGTTFIKSQNIGTNGVTDKYYRRKLIIPHNANKVGIAYYGSIYGVLEKGTTAGLSDIVAKVDTLDMLSKGYETKTGTEYSGKYYDKTSGSLVSVGGWLSKYYAIDKNKDYYVTTNTLGTPTAMAVYFDRNGKIISSQNNGTASTVVYYRYKLIIPNGAYYVGVTSYGATYSTLEEYKNNINTIAKDFVLESGRAESSGGYYAKSTGVFTAVGGWLSKKYRIMQGIDYYVTTNVSGSVTAMVVYIQEDGTYISSENDGTSGVTDVYTREKLTVPSNADYVLITSYGSTYPTLESYVYQPITETEATDLIISNYDLANYWNGKNIAWFGTSIPESGYPDTIGNYLGANVYNEALGSSMVRRANSTDSTYVGMYYTNVLRSLSQTKAEKNTIMQYWTTGLNADGSIGGAFGWKDLMIGSPPTSYTTYADSTTIANWSYEHKLKAKYLDSTDPNFVVAPDLFVFDHGHNDLVTTSYDASDSIAINVPIDRDDRNYFIGAMNFLIDTIFAYNPRARIVFIGHYENDRKTRIYQAQENLQDVWDFELCKLWEKLGWSQQEVTTTGYWSGGTWFSSGGAPQTLTMTQIWMQDNLHPYSAPAKQKIARILADWLKGIR